MKLYSFKKKNNQMRISLLVKTFLLIQISLLIAAGVSLIITTLHREKNAMEVGGAATRQACTMVVDYLNQTDFDKEDFLNTQIAVERTTYLRDFMFPELCNVLNLKYVYLYTVDDKDVRHHVVSVARSPEDQKMLDEYGFPGSTSNTPLRDNEKAALRGVKTGTLIQVDNRYGKTCNCVMPYYDQYGDLAAIVGADCELSDVIKENNKEELNLVILGVISQVIRVSLLLISLYLWVVMPILNLSKRMENYREDTGKVKSPRKILFKDEVSDMEDSYRDMTKDISAYVSDIEKLTSERVKADVQLQVAKRIQSGMVPPEKEYIGDGCSIYAVMQPALAIGGDFYDVFSLPKGRVGFVIGDISGKGVSAALFMSMVHRILRDRLRTGMNPAKALKRANDEIYRENPEGFFATVFAAVWDPKEGKLVYSNAGHLPPIHLGKTTENMPFLEGDMLGLFDDAAFNNETLKLEYGEGLMLYTDGVTEAVNGRRESYGVDRLIKKVSELKKDSEIISKNIMKDVLSFQEGTEVFDDITLITFFRHEMEKLVLLPELSEVDRMKERIQSFVNDETLAYSIITACEEWFVDIISYSGATNIVFDIVRENQLYLVTFSDNGNKFDPTLYNFGDKPFEELDQGGMGIEMIRGMTSELRYERIEHRNVVTLVFDTNKEM